MAKKMCSVCGNKAGLLGFDIKNDQRICADCFAAAGPHMKASGIGNTDTWTIEEVRVALGRHSNEQENFKDLTIVSTEFITGKNLKTISVVSGSRFVFSGVIGEEDINRAINDMKLSAAR